MNIREAVEQGRYANKIPYSKATRAQYQEEEARLYVYFREDLAREYGVVGHPKEVQLFEMAWRHGHASGYAEVVGFYEEFVELLKN